MAVETKEIVKNEVEEKQLEVKPKKSLFKKLKMVLDMLYFMYGMIRLIFKPNDISPIFVNGSIIREHKAYQQSLAAFLENKDVKKLVDERYRSPKAHDLIELAKLPEGTLGKTFSEHMTKNKLEVVFYPPMDDKVDDEVTYLINRARETHDIHHVVLSLPAVDIGEMAISGFYLAQNKVPLSAFLIGIGFLYTILREPTRIEELVNSVIFGWNTGKNAKCVFAVKWEELWEKPLSEIRKELNIPDISPEDFFRSVGSKKHLNLQKA
ncbi:MAG: Coq4 family protein [Candidatus Sericytochromatia bacterium]